MRSRLVLFLVLACSSAACSASPTDDAATTEDGYTVTPTGSSAQLGATVPAGTMAAQVLARRKDGAGGIVDLTAGPKPVSPGAYCVWTRVNGTSAYDFLFDTQSDCSVNVAAGAKVTYDLGAVQITRARDELVFGIDVAFASSTDPTHRFLLTTQPVPHANGSFGYAYAYLTGTYQPLDTIAFTVASGKTTKADLLDTTGRFGVRVLPATPRALPNTTTRVDATVATGYSTRINAWVDLGSLPKPLLVRSTTSASLQVSAPTAQVVALTQPPSDKALGRLEVQDVAVTMPDGSVKSVRGTVTVGALSFPTNSGIDLLPATYDLTVSYAHPADGAQMKDTYSAPVTP